MDGISVKEVLIVVIIIVGSSSISMWWHLKKRKSAWKGVVKKVVSKKKAGQPGDGSHGEITTHHYIYCRLDTGGNKNIKLSNIQMHSMFPSGVREGDHIIKISGEDGYRLES